MRKADEDLLYLSPLLALVAIVFLIGLSGKAPQDQSDQNITEAKFGWYGIDNPSDFPHCQTDMAMSDKWSPQLVYLNGVWTAGCVAQSIRLQKEGE